MSRIDSELLLHALRPRCVGAGAGAQRPEPIDPASRAPLLAFREWNAIARSA
ncbi:hypothetical protein predicted by Glimmer/Critica [Sorangium cellulosum So ce56]|uniref:Uncharacterized protein n=1 Tax=Sorangium cellulosum (strain So ce56) TaxID=448385 RepID=A9GDI2_SORC5|nr:hypothetical protein predicted by Glimmer/Critica [Sorangium cellulosum So ce56]